MIKYLLLSASAASVAVLGFTFYDNNVQAFSSGAPVGKTGAPGENNCTQCHTGSPSTNNTIITHDLQTGDLYTPGNTYSITITNGANGQENGFQITAKDAAGNTAGEFMANTDVQIQDNGQYATHKGSSTSLNAWTVDWVAPAEGTGEVTFYAATNAGNGNGTTAGDQVTLGSTTVQEAALVGTPDLLNKPNIQVYPNPLSSTEQITIKTPLEGNAHLSLYDVKGQRIYDTQHIMLEGQSVQLPLNLSSGIYFLKGTIADQVFSQRIVVRD